MQDANKQGDRIGMLLDLDQGSMTVWKNGILLGVMQAEGVSGPLCWAAGLAKDHIARIESAPRCWLCRRRRGWRLRRCRNPSLLTTDEAQEAAAPASNPGPASPSKLGGGEGTAGELAVLAVTAMDVHH